MKTLCELTVVANRRLGDEVYLLTFELPSQNKNLLYNIRAGQFAMLHCDETEPFRFPRPFSFASIDDESGTFDVYFKVVGDRTRRLAASHAGAHLTGLLPLGNAFTVPSSGAPAILIAGSVGVAPLLLLAMEIAAEGLPEPFLFFGARTSAELALDYVSGFPVTLYTATDDGTYGFHGTVVELVSSESIAGDAQVYACGPSAMLKSLLNALPAESSVQVSLEEIMACGIGACYGCAVPTRSAGNDAMSLVCREGPVFDLRRVQFTE